MNAVSRADARAILTKARALIEDPERWIKGEFAEDEQGMRVKIDSPHACRFCLVGAVRRATDEAAVALGEEMDLLNLEQLVGIGAIVASVLPIGRHTWMVSEFNDYSGTTHGDVLGVLDRAIAESGGSEA